MNAPPTLRRIRPLPNQLANQIAAGEVVERPASVVKELVENSIDAGAVRIDVEVRDGGVRLIQVRDDGGGIHPEDLPLALRSHATSKVTSLEELASVLSLGFRGEALASIASVARFSITSRQADHPGGYRIDEQGVVAPAAHPVGTTVEVRDLFHNTPARRKFLRSERTEFGHVEDICRRLALARSEVAFTLSHNGRTVFSAPAARDENGRELRLAALTGKGFLRHALAIRYEGAGLVLHGWIGEPGYSRPQADLQHCFLNGRAIRDRLVSHALRQACQEVIEGGRHPAYVLYLETDPERVDVNVHPTKHEVRFREARMVHDFLVSAIRSALSGGAAPTPDFLPGGGAPDAVAEAAFSYRPASTHPARDAPPDTENGGLLFDRYALVRQSGRQLLVDLTAAWRAYVEAALGQGAEPVPLLIPEVVEPSAGSIEEAVTALSALGFEVDHLGGGSLVLRAAPRVFDGLDLKALFSGMPIAVPLVPELAARAAAARLARAAGSADEAFAGLPADIWRGHATELHPADFALLMERRRVS